MTDFFLAKQYPTAAAQRCSNLASDLTADALKVHVGVWAHAIFFGLFLYTGLFFGYGWSFFIISSGYTLGWWAVVTANVGTLLGGILGFVSSRRCMRGAVERKVKSLPGTWSRRIGFFQSEIERSTVAYLLVSGTMRNSNLLTFGMANGECAGRWRRRRRERAAETGGSQNASACVRGLRSSSSRFLASDREASHPPNAPGAQLQRLDSRLRVRSLLRVSTPQRSTAQ